ncbi:WD40-repeat-containing domain protein [Hygrophoropsis aurantiaca]|uniref:WD40-repeat-containing domain protein n=1 Tax=Hygrophoropsis aurantiaca TaxID=72124 RepID=A0ACB7ZUF0_9AGAM|nr:WD40-repeat-containing domain protein [Hygrophoropsis aurantiaca]
MPTKTYQLHRNFKGHTRPINCLRFSRNGAYLASGADDGNILVWSIHDNSLSRIIEPRQGPIVALQWLTSRQKGDGDYLVSGGADGTVQLWFQLHSGDSFRFLIMYTVLDGPIEDITINDAQDILVVIGLGRVVLFSVRLDQQSPLKLIHAEPAMPDPPTRALARSVHFFRDGQCFMVFYLDSKEMQVVLLNSSQGHPIHARTCSLAWQISPWCLLWRNKLTTRIGNTSWSEENRMLLVWNLLDGVDVYHFKDEPTDRFTLVRKLRMKIRVSHCVQVDFDLHGKTAIHGSDNGEVFLWTVDSGEQVQVLTHGHGIFILFLTYHSPQSNKHFIASGSSDVEDVEASIKVWSLGSVRSEFDAE